MDQSSLILTLGTEYILCVLSSLVSMSLLKSLRFHSRFLSRFHIYLKSHLEFSSVFLLGAQKVQDSTIYSLIQLQIQGGIGSINLIPSKWEISLLGYYWLLRLIVVLVFSVRFSGIVSFFACSDGIFEIIFSNLVDKLKETYWSERLSQFLWFIKE